MISVFVAGQTMDLDVPRRVSTRLDVATASSESKRGQTGVRVCAAALLICWTGAAAKTGKDAAPRYRGDVLDFGGEALDYLISHGATLDSIVTAGNEAIRLVLASVPTSIQVEEARGNSEAPKGGS